MISPSAPLIASHDHSEVVRSIVIAISASYAALDLAGRATAATGRTREAWLTVGAIAMGYGVWAMQFKGMLALRLPVSVEYHWPTILLSLVLAIFASAAALFLVSRQQRPPSRVWVGGLVMGGGIAATHYVEMSAMRFEGVTRFVPLLVALSIVIAIAFSSVALLIAFRLREEKTGTVLQKLGSAAIMGSAISLMHYTGVAAANFMPSALPAKLSHAVGIAPLGNYGLVIVTFLVLGAASWTSAVDRQTQARIQKLNASLEQFVVERTRQLAATNEQLRSEIAERQSAEDGLRRSEDYLRLVIDTIPHQIWSGPSEGTLDFCNAQWRSYTGLTKEELQGDGWQRMLHPDDRERVLNAWRESVANGTPYEQEERHGRPGGRYRWFLARGVPLRDSQGCIVRWFGTNTDIEERKHAEAELRESEARFRLVADSAPVMIWMAGTEKLWIYFNKPWIDFTGRSIDRELGNGWTEGVYPEDLKQCLDTYIQSFDRREPFKMHYRLRRYDGEFRWILDVGVPRFHPDGSFAGYIGSCTDVTDQRRAEERLRRAQEDLARVTRVVAMGELAAAIAHEVNQPLTAIVTNASYCVRQIAGGAPHLGSLREAISEIMNDGTRASDIISRIRTLLRKGVPARAELDINLAISEAATFYRDELIRNGVSFHLDLAPDLPRVFGDRVQLQQVLINLLVNGIEAMRSITHRPRRLLIKSGKVQDEILIQVQDTGTGLAPEQAEHIFEPFFTTKPEGIGMGLSISRSIVESHGGRLWAEFAPAGARLQFTLPAQQK